MTEKKLRPSVEAWLHKQGLYVAHEVMLCNYCDLIGCKWAERVGRRIPAMTEIVAVELKIKDILGVIDQAKTNCTVADFSYAAMPFQLCHSMREVSLKRFENAGIGLIAVSQSVATVIIPARKNLIDYHPCVCRRLWNYKTRHLRASAASERGAQRK